MKKVLYIEDDRMLYDLIHEIIGPIAEIDYSPDMKTTREHIKSNTYDFIIADVELPDGNSLDFFAELKEKEISVPPIIFLSGHESVENKIKCYKVGGKDYLVKPADPKALAARVELLIKTGN